MAPPTPQPSQLLFLFNTHPRFLTLAPSDQSFLSHENLCPADSSWQTFWTLDISLSVTLLQARNLGTQALSSQGSNALGNASQMLIGSLLPRTTEQESPLSFVFFGGSSFLLFSLPRDNTWEVMGIKE